MTTMMEKQRRRPGLPRGSPNMFSGGVGGPKPSYIPGTLDWQWSFEDSAQPSGATATVGTWAFVTDVAPPLDAGNVAMESTAPGPSPDPAYWRSPTITSKSNVPTVVYAWVYMDVTTASQAVCVFQIANTWEGNGSVLTGNRVLRIDMRWIGGAQEIVDIRVQGADGFTTLLTAQPHKVWHKLEFRNIDYVAFTADIYIDNIFRANKGFINNESTITACGFESSDYPTGAQRILHDLVTVGRG